MIPNDNSGYSKTTAWQQGRIIQNAFKCGAELRARENLKNALITPGKGKPPVMYYKNDRIDEHMFIIHQGEMVFSRAYNAYGRIGLGQYISANPQNQSSALDNGYPSVFSSLNGAGEYHSEMKQSDFDLLTPDEKKNIIRSNFVFQGIAQATVDNTKEGIHSVNGRTDLAIMVGGVETCVNTGLKSIMRGDLVLWDVQNPDEEISYYRGSPINPMKRCFVTESLTPDHFANFESVKKVINDDGVRDIEKINIYQLNARMDTRDNYHTMQRVVRAFIKLANHFMIIGSQEFVAAATNEERANVYAEAARDIFVNNQDIADTLNNFKLCILGKRNYISFNTGVPLGSFGKYIYDTSISDFFSAIAHYNSEIHTRIIQRALSTAAPGDPYDAVIGHGYCI